MGKIKINLSTGSEMEKPLINAFKVGNDEFVILDNESVGSMGLPIILVSKLENNKLNKIVDQTEWQKAKEYLKNIIAGNPIEFINVNSFLSADEMFYTQLTLPLASFDALKNNYKPAGESAEVSTPAVMPEIEPVMPTIEPAPAVIPEIEPVMPTIEPAPAVMPEIEPVMPTVEPAPAVMPEIEPVMPTVEPAPAVMPEIEPVMPTIEPAPAVMPEIAPVMPAIDMPQIAETTINDDKYKDLKESFMKSCENMFDALIVKFENKE